MPSKKSSTKPSARKSAATAAHSSGDKFRTVRRVVVLLDLTNYVRTFRERSGLELAQFLDEFYADCVAVFTGAGGRVVKFMGDACLAVFDETGAEAAVDAVLGMKAKVAVLSARIGADMEVGANIHLDAVTEGEFGPAGHARYDIVGSAVNATFLLGRGAGIRLTEPVYRQLPSHRRTPWQKQKPPAIYSYAAE